MSRRVSTRALLAHHLRSHAGGGAAVGFLVFLLSLLATLAPLALAAVGDAGLRARLDVLAPTRTDVVSETAGFPALPVIPPTTPQATEDVWGAFAAGVIAARADAERPLPDILGVGRMLARNFDNPVVTDSRTRAVTLAFDPDYEDDIRIVEGRLPEPAPGVLPEAEVTPEGVRVVNRVEAVMSRESAEQMEWAVGESRAVGPRSQALEVVLVGVFEAADPGSSYWQHADSVLQPYVFDDGNAPRRVTATAYAHPASLVTDGVGGRSSTLAWYPLDADAVDGADAEQIVTALREFTAVGHSVGTSEDGSGILSVRFETDITGEIEAALGEQLATAGVIAMLIAGPVGVAAAVLVLGCRLILENRRASLRLVSARGASAAQLRAVLGAEGVVAGIVAALLGAVVAVLLGQWLLGRAPAPAGWIPAVLIGLAPIAILVVLAPSVAERRPRADIGPRGSRIRTIAEGVVVGLAAVALTLLFARGYSGQVDVLLAATPLLLALVACLVTLRLYPLPLRAVFARTRAGRDLDGFLGSARALREPSIGLTPVLALVVGVSVAVSSGILLSALQTGIDDTARAQVGADVKLSGQFFTVEQIDAIAGTDGVAAVAGLSDADPGMLEIDGGTRGTSVFVVDAAALREVQEEGPGLLPAGVSLEPGPGAMPLLASAYAARAIGDAADLGVNGVEARLVGVSEGPVPIGSRENWVAIDSSYAADVLRQDPVDRIVLLRLEPEASANAVVADVRAIVGERARIDTAADITARIFERPSVEGVRWALLAATALAALFSALALVMTLTLAAGPRARVLALLRTLGAPSRSATSLAMWEIGPPSVAAIVAGSAFGALVPLVVMAAVDLRPFTGSTVAPAYQIDPAILALTLGGFVAVAVLLTAVTLFVSQRVRAAGALRTVEEG